MFRIIVIVGVCVMAILPPAAAQSNGTSASRPPWCTINPAQPMQEHSVQIAENKLQVVLASKQEEAKQRLLNDTFVEIDRQEATQLAKNPAALSPAGNYYLVRASAFYVDQNYGLNSRLEAYLYPEEKALQIVNTSLSQPGTRPVDFAVVVDTDTVIQKAEIICLTAA
jgi:hypothetical protein